MSAFTLKSIAFVLMILDHIFYYIVDVPIFFTYLGRIVAPTYFYLLVESFFHTRNRKKFTIRLFVAAFIVMIILNIIFKQPMNIFYSMALGILMLDIIEFIKNNRGSMWKTLFSCIAIIFIIILSLFTEGSYLGIGMVLIFYFLRDKKFWMILSYIILSLIEMPFLLAVPNFIKYIFMVNYQWMMVFAVIPIMLYNGKVGLRNKFFNYFFYIAYPIHIIIILIIGNTINPNWYYF